MADIFDTIEYKPKKAGDIFDIVATETGLGLEPTAPAVPRKDELLAPESYVPSDPSVPPLIPEPDYYDTEQFPHGVFLRAPEKTFWQKVKGFFVSEPKYGRWTKPTRLDYLHKAIDLPLDVLTKLASGATFGADKLTWYILQKIHPDPTGKTLEETMEELSPYEKSGFQSMAGEVAEFIGQIRSAQKVLKLAGLKSPEGKRLIDKIARKVPAWMGSGAVDALVEGIVREKGGKEIAGAVVKQSLIRGAEAVVWSGVEWVGAKALEKSWPYLVKKFPKTAKIINDWSEKRVKERIIKEAQIQEATGEPRPLTKEFFKLKEDAKRQAVEALKKHRAGDSAEWQEILGARAVGEGGRPIVSPPPVKEFGKFPIVKAKPAPKAPVRPLVRPVEPSKPEKGIKVPPKPIKAFTKPKAGTIAAREARKAELEAAKRPKKMPKGFLYVKPLEVAHRTALKVLEPTKLAEKAVGKGPVAAVIKAIHAPEVKRLEFREQQLKSIDKTFGQLRDDFSKYPDDVLENIMLTRGHKLTGKARQLQVKAFAALPKDLKEAKVRRSLDEIADFNYKYLQEVVGDDVVKMRDYFYGIYKSPKLVRQFLKYWKTTKRFTKHKVFPTYADAKAYGLEIRNPNPVDNLMTEYSAIAHLDSMNWLKSELMRLGKGKFIAETKDAPIEWSAIGEGLPIEPTFSDVRIQPDLARVINNLISTNKITQIPILNTIRQVNNFLRTIKFIGSAFHLLSVAKQSVADSGYLGFYKPTAYKGVTPGFRKDDPIFRTTQYKDYIQHGGGHRYSVESEAQRIFTKTIAKLTRNERAIIKAGGTPLKIPVSFVNWMFKSYIPKVKYAKYLDTVAEKERKLDKQLASAEKIDIIKEQQNFYGMMNERLFGRSGTFTTLLRFIFMAPGYAEGNYRTILKAGLQKGAHRSRSNIINSWLITGTLATIGTLILTGKWPKKPEDLDDIRDLFKIDTGKKDKRNQRIMIDLMTYDKDYWNVYFNVARLRPDKALSLSVRRIGGMRAPTADFVIDLLKLWRGEALVDWKEDKIYNLTDPFLLKVIKTAKLETERLIPISASVFKQSRQREIDKTTAAVEMLLGFRPTRTERDKREFKIVRDLWSLRDQREKLAYRLDKYDDPMAAVRVYNNTIGDIINSKFVRERAPNLISKGEKLLIDEEKVKIWTRYPVKKMTERELRKAIVENTYKREYKRDGKWYPKGYAHKGKEDRIKELREELAKRR